MANELEFPRLMPLSDNNGGSCCGHGSPTTPIDIAFKAQEALDAVEEAKRLLGKTVSSVSVHSENGKTEVKLQYRNGDGVGFTVLDGKDGADGNPGQPGAPGPMGPQGPKGEDGNEATASAIESANQAAVAARSAAQEAITAAAQIGPKLESVEQATEAANEAAENANKAADNLPTLVGNKVTEQLPSMVDAALPTIVANKVAEAVPSAVAEAISPEVAKLPQMVSAEVESKVGDKVEKAEAAATEAAGYAQSIQTALDNLSVADVPEAIAAQVVSNTSYINGNKDSIGALVDTLYERTETEESVNLSVGRNIAARYISVGQPFDYTIASAGEWRNAVISVTKDDEVRVWGATNTELPLYWILDADSIIIEKGKTNQNVSIDDPLVLSIKKDGFVVVNFRTFSNDVYGASHKIVCHIVRVATPSQSGIVTPEGAAAIESAKVMASPIVEGGDAYSVDWANPTNYVQTESDYMVITPDVKCPRDGHISKIRLKASINLVIFQIRYDGELYKEIKRTEIITNRLYGEYDVDFDVKAGDLFGYKNVKGLPFVVINGQRTRNIAITETPLSFSSFGSAYSYNQPAISPIYDTELNQSALEQVYAGKDSPYRMLRASDIKYSAGQNKFDKSLLIEKQRVKLYEGVAVISTDSAASRVTIVPCVEDTWYTINHDDGLWGTGSDVIPDIVSFLDSDFKSVGYMELPLLNTLSTRYPSDMIMVDRTHVAFKTIPGSRYFAINVSFDRGSYADTMQVVEGIRAVDYKPFMPIFADAILGNPIRVPESNAVKKHDIEYNTYILGDSIATFAYGSWNAPILRKWSFKAYINLAQGGATWMHRNKDGATFDAANAVDPSSGASAAVNSVTTQVLRLIKSVEQGNPIPELVIIHAGTNDVSTINNTSEFAGESYGDPDTIFSMSGNYADFSDITDYRDARLITTCGAIRYAVELLRRTYPSCKVVLTTPIQRSDVTANRGVLQMRKLIMDCAVYLSCGVVDFTAESGIYIKTHSTQLADGVHPRSGSGGRLLADCLGNYLVSHFGSREPYELE